MMEKVTASVKMTDKTPPEGFVEGTRSWRVGLDYDGRSIDVDYFTGPAIEREPSAEEVLETLVLDASTVAGTDTFEEWAESLGYSTDSRSAERIYRAVVDQTEELRFLLGEDFLAALEGDES